MDGCAVSVVSRTAGYASSGWACRLDDIPHGVYTAAATRVRGGVRTPLKVGRLGSGQVAPTTTVSWEPNRPGSCGHVLGPDLAAFSLQLENP